MIEIMCRDGSVPPELLENVADYVRAVVSDDVEVLDEDEHRAEGERGDRHALPLSQQLESPAA